MKAMVPLWENLQRHKNINFVLNFYKLLGVGDRLQLFILERSFIHSTICSVEG